MVSEEKYQVIRQRGREASMHALHSTGMAGIASRREEMEKASPTSEVKRANLYTHVYQDIPEENIDPTSYKATSRNYVRMVIGCDGRGVVRSMILKTELLASAVSRVQLHLKKLKTAGFETCVRSLVEIVGELRAGMAHNPSTINPNNAQPENVGCRRIQNVVLRNMHQGAVAFGRINRNLNETDDYYYPVLIDEIVIHSEPLCVGDGTLANIPTGEKIKWPKHSLGPWQVTDF